MHLIQILFITFNLISLLRSFSMNNTRIINGWEATKNYPWIARIVVQYKVEIEGNQRYWTMGTDCGGSLIASKWVLTAKHCILDDDLKLLSDEFHVSIGNRNYMEGEVIKVKKLLFYSRNNLDDNDIVLLKLRHAPQIDKPIPVQYKDNFNYEGQVATLYGWGMTVPDDPGSSVQNLRIARVVLSSGIIPGFESLTEMCKDKICFKAKDNKNRDIAFGDSGGPMTLMIDGVETLIGVAHGQSMIKTTDEYGRVKKSDPISSFVRTGYQPYANWIKRKIRKRIE